MIQDFRVTKRAGIRIPCHPSRSCLGVMGSLLGVVVHGLLHLTSGRSLPHKFKGGVRNALRSL